ncbi:hypothetical protein BC332_00863 [Capsicum chinense]|nr:hypothetical protein BC332_00863 [Capsicum chinense]
MVPLFHHTVNLLHQMINLLPQMVNLLHQMINHPQYGQLYVPIVSEDRSIIISKTGNFVSFVENVLNHSVSSKTKKIVLDGRDLWSYESQIRQWLSFAVERKVVNVFFCRDVFLYVNVLPESFCTCSSLITLHLRCCRFDDLVIAWKFLKSLKLEQVTLNDDQNLNLNNDQILNLLSGLETMELYQAWGFRRLEINSPNFKRLSLKSQQVPYEDINDHSLEIIAPYLEHLEISGNLEDLKCRLVDVSSLVNAKLTFYISCIKHIRNIWA